MYIVQADATDVRNEIRLKATNGNDKYSQGTPQESKVPHL